MWVVSLKGGVFILVELGVGVALAEEAVRDGDADKEKVEKLPCSREEGGAGGVRDLGREKGEEGDKYGEDDGFVEEA